MRKYIKFTGNFRDLIPDGWKFGKAFARNYRYYRKECDGEYSQHCTIWQHLGGYMEIEDFFSNSYIIVEKIIKGEIGEWITTHRDHPPETVCWTYYDLEMKIFYPYHSNEYHNIEKSKWDKWKELQEHTITNDEYRTWQKDFRNRYRECNFDLKLFDMIKDLVDKGWIEVAEDNRKPK